MSSSLSQLWDEFTELSRSAKAPHLRFELVTPQPQGRGHHMRTATLLRLLGNAASADDADAFGSMPELPSLG